LTFFRVALAPPTAAIATNTEAVSLWRSQQIYVAHFAITDVARNRFKSTQKFERDALGLAGAAAAPLHVWLDDWVLQAGTPATGWTLHAQDEDYELSLNLQPMMAPVLNGERGLSRKSDEPGNASYYYSIPRMAARGRLVREGAGVAGQPLDVKGLAWLDREWGSGSLGARQQGWDWFAFQLSDGSTLMFYALRRQDGTRDAHSAGTWVNPAGQASAISSDDVQIDVSDYWVSPRGGRYPSRWRLRVASLGLDTEVQPVLAGQELRTAPRYWEGAVDVRGSRQGRNISGRGYVELVGYAK
jgi:predicted secreted hydrolase